MKSYSRRIRNLNIYVIFLQKGKLSPRKPHINLISIKHIYSFKKVSASLIALRKAFS